MQAQRQIALLLLTAGYGMALSYGHIGYSALPYIALLGLLGIAARQARLAWLGHGGFVVLALGLALHRVPGFDNALIIDRQVLSTGAPPFSLFLNLDKPLIGAWILLCCPWAIAARTWGQITQATVRTLAITASGLFGLALALHAVAWAPKWPAGAWLWAANNLLLVSLSEELLFRGYLLGWLSDRWQRWRWSVPLAISLSAVLFGLTHLGGGWTWALLATLAGIGYGLAWRYGGLLAATGCHFGINLIHFGLFTYPLKL